MDKINKETPIKAYKGFNPDFTCREMQYEVGKGYEMPEDGIKVCKKGFHACESPLEVLDHYFLTNKGEMCCFAEVEQSGSIDREENSTKVCSSRIKVKAELRFGDLIKAGVEWLKEVTKSDKIDDRALSDNGGYSARIGSSGDSARIGSSGDSAQIDSTGEDSVICCAGHGSRVRAKLGSWVTLAEWKYDDNKVCYVPLKVVSFQIDGDTYKPDTWYTMENGEIIEAE